MKTTTNKTTARVFLTDYASYNNGTQFEFGHWVDLSQFSYASEFMEYVREHFEECDKESPLDSPRKEIMITDYEGFPSQLYSESMNEGGFQELFEYLEAVEASYLDTEVVEAYIENCGYWEGIVSDAEEAYCGQYDSDEDFAQEIAEELGYIDSNASWPHTCIDWEWAARELMYDYFEMNGYYFRNI